MPAGSLLSGASVPRRTLSTVPLSLRSYKEKPLPVPARPVSPAGFSSQKRREMWDESPDMSPTVVWQMRYSCNTFPWLSVFRTLPLPAFSPHNSRKPSPDAPGRENNKQRRSVSLPSNNSWRPIKQASSALCLPGSRLLPAYAYCCSTMLPIL